jgi:hypothetical protein
MRDQTFAGYALLEFEGKPPELAVRPEVIAVVNSG